MEHLLPQCESALRAKFGDATRAGYADGISRRIATRAASGGVPFPGA